MKIKNLVFVGLLLISINTMGCATTGSRDDLRSKLSERNSYYCCVLNDSFSDVTPSRTP